jgi:hypothetical protein
VNEYHWGNFRGDPDHLIAHYFDVMLYFANWGTHRLLIGFPNAGIDVKSWRQFESENGLEIRKSGERLILDFCSETEDPDYMDENEGAGLMASLAPVREELLSSDLRAMFLARLAGLYAGDSEEGDADDQEMLPATPAGLGELTTAQRNLADFLRVDQDILAAAARTSPALRPPPSELTNWIAALPEREKDQLLLDLASGKNPRVGPEIVRRYRASIASPISTGGERQPASEFIRVANNLRQAREAEERRLAKLEKQRRDAKAAAARKQKLEELASSQEQAWRQIEEALKSKKVGVYDQLVSTLSDLHEVAIQQQSLEHFTARMARLRAAHRAKYSLIQRLDKAGL